MIAETQRWETALVAALLRPLCLLRPAAHQGAAITAAIAAQSRGAEPPPPASFRSF